MLLICIIAAVNVITINADCNLDIQKDVAVGNPLILTADGKDFVALGTEGLHFEENDTLLLACPGDGNELTGTKKKHMHITCDDKNMFKLDSGTSKPFEEFTCKFCPSSTARANDKTCGPNNEFIEIEIGFEIDNGEFVRTIMVCFDNVHKDAIYSRFELLHTIGLQQRNTESKKCKRPEFKPAGFYKNLPKNQKIDEIYNKDNELQTLSRILGSVKKAKEYIHLTDDYFLSRGHLTANLDFIYATQQRSTFYYVNAAPQWQIFNDGNWKNLEISVKKFVSKKKISLTVYTGASDVLELRDTQKHYKPFHLYWHNATYHMVAVPKIFWKVLYYPEDKSGVLFIGHNNPYETNPVQICKNVCDQIDYVNWEPNVISKGFSYCCEVNDVLYIKNMLNIEVKKLLT